jgi:hexosaminidase
MRNDILADAENLPKSTAIMSWLGEEAIKEATKDGFKAVATPASHLYFDITQADRNDGTMTDLAYPQINSLKKCMNLILLRGLVRLRINLSSVFREIYGQRWPRILKI